MARVPTVTRENLKPEDLPYFDELARIRGTVTGPYSVLLHVPKLAARVGATGDYVRFEGDLSGPLREAVILAVASEIGAQYVFTGHAGLARQAGLSDETIRAIVDGTVPDGLPEDQATALRYARELIRDHKVSNGTFGAALDRLGVGGMVELTALVGHYLTVGHVLNAFEVELPPGMAPELPQ